MKTTTTETPLGIKRTIKVPSRSRPLTVRISRKKWWRGNGGYNSKLLLPENQKMCCLGFDALALGFKRNDIYNEAEPSCLYNVPGLAQKAVATKTCQIMMEVNDQPELNEEQRERQLKALAKRIGRRFVFVP